MQWRSNLAAAGAGCDGTYNRFKPQSIKGDRSFEILPPLWWSWTSNEQLWQMQQPQTPGSYCSQGEPMNAEQYLKRFFGPQELGSPEIVSVNTKKELISEMQQSNDKVRQELMK